MRLNSFSRLVLLGALTCLMTACMESALTPQYQPDLQSGIDIHDYELRNTAQAPGLNNMYFTVTGYSRPVFQVHADPSGRVELYALNQEMTKSAASDKPFQVHCDTARLVIGDKKFEPLKKTYSIENAGWRVAPCFETKTIRGEDDLIGVVMEFNFGKSLPDTFSIELPQFDHGSGPTKSTLITVTKRMVQVPSSGMH